MGLRNMVASVMALVFSQPKVYHTGRETSVITDPNASVGRPQTGCGKRGYHFYSMTLQRRKTGRRSSNTRDDQRKCGRGY